MQQLLTSQQLEATQGCSLLKVQKMKLQTIMEMVSHPFQNDQHSTSGSTPRSQNQRHNKH